MKYASPQCGASRTRQARWLCGRRISHWRAVNVNAAYRGLSKNAVLSQIARPTRHQEHSASTCCTAMVAVLLVTVPSRDLTINETLLPVGADCGMAILIWTTPGNPGACTAVLQYAADQDSRQRVRIAQSVRSGTYSASVGDRRRHRAQAGDIEESSLAACDRMRRQTGNRSGGSGDRIVGETYQYRVALAGGWNGEDDMRACHDWCLNGRGRDAVHGDYYWNCCRNLTRGQNFERNLRADEKI